MKTSTEDSLTDIYDGNVWKDFMNLGGLPFLSLPYNFALAMNVDRFQPFNTVHIQWELYTLPF